MTGTLLGRRQPPRAAPGLRGLDAAHFAQRSYAAAQPFQNLAKSVTVE